MVGRLGLTLLCAAVLAGTALAAGGSPRDPQKRHTPADQAWAKAISIHRADLGSGNWRLEQSTDKGNAPKGCTDPDLSDLIETGADDNPAFSRNGSFVSSGVSIFQNERQATTAWGRFSRLPMTRCLIASLKEGVAGSGLRLRILSTGPAATTMLAPHFTSGQVRLVLSGAGARIKGHVSYYNYARGRAGAILMIASFGRPLQPIPDSLERKLARLVAQRLDR